MKLLKKSEVLREVNFQKKLQVDEGVHIATRVDTLRKTLAELEIQYSEIASKKQIELTEQFKTLESEIREKIYEISTLEDRRIELLKPLDKELEMIKKLQSKQETKEQELSTSFLELKQAQKEIDIKEKKLNKELKSLEEKLQDTEIKSSIANENLKKSEEILRSAQAKETNIDNFIATENTRLLAREALVASKERELTIKESQLETDRKEITNQRLQLEDREATLEREIKRRNK